VRRLERDGELHPARECHHRPAGRADRPADRVAAALELDALGLAVLGALSARHPERVRAFGSLFGTDPT
jgi:hypothetical protein